MKIELRTLSAAEYPEWDGKVDSCPGGTLFHSTTWLKAGRKPFEIYGAFDANELVGGFVAEYEKLKNGIRVSARSRLTPYSGQVVFANPEKQSSANTVRKAIATAAACTLKEQLKRVNVRLSPFTPDVQPYVWAGFTANVRYTYLIDVDCLDAAWANLDENHRRSVKNARKAGLAIDSDIRAEDCVELFRASRESPESWVELLKPYSSSLSAGGSWKTLGVRDEKGSLAAAVLIVSDRFRSYYLLGGYRRDDDRISRAATTFGLWEAMRYTREELGLKQFDLEGSMIPGVELFFRKFGGELTPYYTISWGHAPASVGSLLRRAVAYASRLRGSK